jgi:glycosyltransferase involved in cell wall biosynthesis
MCISEYVRKGLPPGVDSVVIDNPFVRAAVDRRTAREELARNVGHVDDETLVIGFFGRLVGWKHPETVIDTVATIRNRSSRSVIACLFGADPDDLASQLTDHAKRLGVAHRIDLMGFKDPVAPWIAASDVVLAPSEDEPFGRSLVEAMLLGTPVVASRSGAHPEVIEDGRTGLLVDLGNVEQMAAAVEALADDAGLRDRIIAAALEKARAHYSVDSHVAKVLELYESILTR